MIIESALIRIVPLFVCLIAVSCSSNSEGVVTSSEDDQGTTRDSLLSESVLTRWAITELSEGPPFELEIGPSITTEDHWLTQEVTLKGAQSGQEVTVQLAPEYQLNGSTLEPISEDDGTQFTIGFSEEQRTRVFITNPLDAGEHTATLALSVSVDGHDIADEETTITLSYVVPELTGEELMAFCEEAPGLASGVQVTGDLLDDLLVLADEYLEEQERQLLANEVSALREDLAAFESGTGSAFETGGVVDNIGLLCNLDLESESVG